jgi:hypothetical protein
VKYYTFLAREPEIILTLSIKETKMKCFCSKNKYKDCKRLSVKDDEFYVLHSVERQISLT